MGDYTATPEDNLLGLTDKNLINEEEAKGVIRAEMLILSLEEDIEIQPGLILEIHRVAFSHLYEWAGKWRTRNLNVGNFVPPDYSQVPTLMYSFTDQVKFWLHTAQSETEIAHCLAYAHHKLVQIHPFLNGNGRTARLFTDLLCYLKGYESVLLYEREQGSGRKKYLQAIKLADANDYSLLQEMISSQLRSLD